MVLGLVLTTLSTTIYIVNPFISGIIVDDVITGGNYALLPKLIGCLLGVTLINIILRFLYQIIFETCSQGILFQMRDKVYRKLLQEDFAFYNRRRTGDLLSRQTGDMDAIRHFVANIIYTVYQNILLFLFAPADDLYCKYKACALYADRSAFHNSEHLLAGNQCKTGISPQPRLLYIPEYLCSGKYQRKPCRKGICERTV